MTWRRRSSASACADCLRSSRTVLRRAPELALVAALLAGCGGAGSPGAPSPSGGALAPSAATASPTAPVSERVVAFRDAGSSSNSGRDSVGVEAVREGGGLRITAHQGEQRSGGYSIRIERITRVANELRVHARFTEPGPGSFNTMALTSPAHTVTVDETADVVVLYDTTGVEQARGQPR